jgi:hypothetical protein
MLECHNMDIFPLVVGDYEAEKTPENRSQALFNDVEEEGWCLFTIDVRNTYGLPFEVTLERVQKGLGSLLRVRYWPYSLLCRCCPSIDKLYCGPRGYETVRKFEDFDLTGFS